ncbi:MAG: orotidine-5'-phosphate decarboxylase [Oscillospiraceae bacterium]|nr:orotidine-5'-phosphate decarboxylase [Oscillospiraceae bacterium]
MKKRDVIIACDFKDKQTTLDFLELFPPQQKPFVKIGMELFYSEGPDIVREIRGRNHDVFLDLKLHDIPNTVMSAMRIIAGLDVQITNIHASTNEMMQAALEGLRSVAGDRRPLLIAVTQLTSTSNESLREQLLIHCSMEETIKQYAMRAEITGLDGVVCSPLETEWVKQVCGTQFIAVTPGIRYPEGIVGDDQSRVTTPQQASLLGCDYIVVGRPITRADNPLAAYRQTVKDFLGE